MLLACELLDVVPDGDVMPDCAFALVEDGDCMPLCALPLAEAGA